MTLTHDRHDRDRAGLTYVYPVVSRRARGVLVGINLNHAGQGRLRPIALMAAGFTLPLLLLVPWLWLHPEMLQNLALAYGKSDPGSLSATQALADGRSVGDVFRLVVSTYWGHFDPSFLFVTGSPSRAMSTGMAGVFLWPVAVLLPAGLMALARGRAPAWTVWVLLAGLFSAPVLASLKGTPFAIQRATALLPFAVLVSVFGLSLRKSLSNLFEL